jgi:hypothetical protein
VRTGASDAPRGVGDASGAGALVATPTAARVERMEALLERVLLAQAPRSVQEPKPHVDVAQQELAKLVRDERVRHDQSEQAWHLASHQASQQASQQAYDERTRAADRAHEAALEANRNMLAALKATAESHARRRKRKKNKKKKAKSKKQKPESEAQQNASSDSSSSSSYS